MDRPTRKSVAFVLLLGVFGLVLGGCETLGLDEPAVSLTGHEWRLDALRTPQGDILSVEELTATDGGTSYTLTFSDDGSMGGVADCNRYGASYTLEEGNEIRLESPHHTMAGCPTGTREPLFFRAISRVEGYRVDGEDLRLRYQESGVLWFRTDAASAEAR